MHFVFLNQYYPPDVAPTGVMLEGVVQGLIRDGHDVTVLCASGGYAGGAGNIERRTSNAEPRSQENGSGVSVTVAGSSNSQPSSVRVLRIGATRYGRGSFVGKLADYVSYYVGVAWRLLTLHPRPERIVALTTPPYLSVLARALSRLRGADHAHWVMDLYPDVMAAHGMMSEGSFGYRILSRLARWGYGGRRCAAVLTLGPDMAERVKEVIGDQSSVIRKEEQAEETMNSDRVARHSADCVHWVPLWGSGNEVVSDQWSVIGGEHSGSQLSTSSVALRRRRNWADDELIVMYSGNIGLGHRFGEVLAVARDLAESPNTPAGRRVRFVFYGGGKRRQEVEEFICQNPGCHVELHDYAPAEILADHLRSADVHLASLDAKWTGTMVPSKLQGIFEAGRPVIFIGAAESSIGSWVIESGGGWVVRPGDLAGLHGAIREARDPKLLMTRGVAAKVYAETHFDKAVNVSRAIAVLLKPH